MRSARDILGDAAPSLGQPGAGARTAAVSGAVIGQTGQVNSAPLGSITGAPPHADLRNLEIIPFTAINNARQATLLAPRQRQNRVIVVTAPLVGFSIFVGPSGVRPGFSFALPGGLPYDIIIPGGQELYACTDAPTYLTVQVLNAPLLIGDKERRATSGL